jgi:hypothetical protein
MHDLAPMSAIVLIANHWHSYGDFPIAGREQGAIIKHKQEGTFCLVPF